MSPQHIPDLLPALEQMGFYRYWATEHYSPAQSASPTIAAALAAGITEEMRVGTGGVLLRINSGLRVAQDFALLELFFAGRIDLGVAGALPGDVYGAEFSRDLTVADRSAYEVRVRRLVAMVRRGTLGEDDVRIGPSSDTKPELWLCGTSPDAAALAGSLGIRFAYHHYLADSRGLASKTVAAAYRNSFVKVDSDPVFAFALFGSCEATYEQARSAWADRFSSWSAPDPRPSPSFCGNGQDCRDQIMALATAYEVDELFLDCFASNLDQRLDGLRRLADELSNR